MGALFFIFRLLKNVYYTNKKYVNILPKMNLYVIFVTFINWRDYKNIFVKK